MQKILLLLCVVLLSLNAQANNHLGGQLYYTNLSPDSVLIKLSLYKSCKGDAIVNPEIIITGVGNNYIKKVYPTIKRCADITQRYRRCSPCDQNQCNGNGYPNGINTSCSTWVGVELLTFEIVTYVGDAPSCNMKAEYTGIGRSVQYTSGCAGEPIYLFLNFNRCTVNGANTTGVLDPQWGIKKQSLWINIRNNINYNNHDSIDIYLSKTLKSKDSGVSFSNGLSWNRPLKLDSTNGTHYWYWDTYGDLLIFPDTQQQLAPLTILVVKYIKSGTNWFVDAEWNVETPLIIENIPTNSPPELKGPFVATGCATERICFTDMETDDQNPEDSVFLHYNGGIPKAVYTTQFPPGSKHKSWSLCWQTEEKDGSDKPYYFVISAQDDHLNIMRSSRNYVIQVNKIPKLDSMWVYEDQYCHNIFQVIAQNVADTSIIWTIPYPGGNNYYGNKVSHQFLTNGVYNFKLRLEGTCVREFIDTVEAVHCYPTGTGNVSPKNDMQVTFDGSGIFISSTGKILEQLPATMFDMSGKVVMQWYVDVRSQSYISYVHLLPGMYMLKLENKFDSSIYKIIRY